MYHSQTRLDTLKRPKLLIRAARAAIRDFRWSRDLDVVKGGSENQNTQKIFDALLEEEHRLNNERLGCEATYNVRKHIRILTALMVVVSGPKARQQAA